MKKGKEDKRRKFKSALGGTRLTLALVLAMMMLCWPACGASTNEAFDMGVSSGPTSTDSYTGGMGGGLIYESTGDYDYKADDTYMETESDKSAAETTQESSVIDERKLIKTVDMQVETKEYDLLMSQLQQQVKEIGGYIERLDTYNGSSYSSYRSARYANMTVRVPKDKLDVFLETVSGISNVVRRSDNVEDVTLSYVDMESRRNTLKVEQDRLLAFLEQAKDIEDIITIEERLSDVRYQLESMESQLRTIDNQVDYSTVYLDVSEVKELTPVAEQTALERMIEGFADSLHDISDGAVEFAIWFIVNIPYFAIWAVIIAVIVLIIRALGKRSRRLKAEKKSEENAVDSAEAIGKDRNGMK